jgi:hypothetical protein
VHAAVAVTHLITACCNRPSTYAGRFARHALVAAALAGVSLARPASAFASLGGTPASVDADRVRSQGSLVAIVRTEAFTRHELRTATGTTIREYVSPGGTVFAVTWQGPWLPDLRQVLGSYFDEYERAIRTRTRRTRGVVQIAEPNFVVVVSGHPRSFSGRAFVPSLAPAGVRAEGLR